MKIVLNGEPHEAPEDGTILSLLESLSLAEKRLAVLKDDEVVPRIDFAQARLAEGARIEIVQMVGGG